MRVARALIAGLCAVLAAVSSAHAATAKQDAPARLAAAVDADALMKANITQQIGDEALLAALRQQRDVVLRLAAVRCAPYLSDPDRALPGLAAIAQGHDPTLAPAAARVMFQIAQSLLRSTALPDIALDNVRVAQSQSLSLADDRTAIASIRLLAGQASFLLGQLLMQFGASPASH